MAGCTEAGWERAPGQGLPRGRPGYPDHRWAGGPRRLCAQLLTNTLGGGLDAAPAPPLLADPVAPPVLVGGRDDV